MLSMWLVVKLDMRGPVQSVSWNPTDSSVSSFVSLLCGKARKQHLQTPIRFNLNFVLYFNYRNKWIIRSSEWRAVVRAIRPSATCRPSTSRTFSIAAVAQPTCAITPRRPSWRHPNSSLVIILISQLVFSLSYASILSDNNNSNNYNMSLLKDYKIYMSKKCCDIFFLILIFVIFFLFILFQGQTIKVFLSKSF